MQQEIRFIFEPGVTYLTPEDSNAFARMIAPGDFDHSHIRKKKLDIQYGTLPEQKLDVFYPEAGQAPYPLIFYVHGGGWILGNRHSSAIECVIGGCLDRGYAVATVDYRLAPETKFPENFYDVKTAVRWARANAAAYDFDPERFGMAGDSAGGYFTLLAAAAGNVPALEGEQYGWPGVSSAIQAAVDYYGPVDMTKTWGSYYAQSGVKCMPSRVEGQPSMEEQEFCNESAPSLAPLVCPDNYIHKDMPPVLLLHGKDDAVVPYQHSVIMAEKMDRICGPGRAELVIYPGRDHSDKDFLCRESSLVAAEFFARVFDR